MDEKGDGSESRSYPADRRAVGQIRDFIRHRAVSDSLTDSVDNVVLAVSEACANAIIHSGTPEIVVTWRSLSDRAEVEVRDEGIFRRAIPSEEAGATSRGILLMMSAMDQITITCGTDARPGTTVRMVKMRNGSPQAQPGERDRTRGSAQPGHPSLRPPGSPVPAGGPP